MAIAGRRWPKMAAFFVLSLSPAIRYLALDLDPRQIVNTDTLAVPAFTQTLRTDGLEAFSEWYWPPAPYVVPDLAVYGPISLLSPNAFLGAAVFMVVQLLALAFAVSFITTAIFGPNYSLRKSWSSVVSFAVLISLATALLPPAGWLLVSYYRAGSFVIVLLTLGVFANAIRKGRPPSGFVKTAVSSVGAFLLVLSDPLMVPALLCPLLAAVFLLCLVDNEASGWAQWRRPAGVTALWVTVAAGAGVILNGAIKTDQFTYGPSVRLAINPLVFTRDSELVNFPPIVMGLFAAAGLAALLKLGLDRRDKGWKFTPFSAVALFTVLSGLSHLGALLLNSEAPNRRYLLVIILLPIALLPALLADLLGVFTSAYLAVAVLRAAAVLATLIVFLPALRLVPSIQGSWVPPEIDCLDEALADTASPQAGIVGYWDSKYVLLFAEAEHEPLVMTFTGETMKINASSDWFDRPTDFAFTTSSINVDGPSLPMMKAFAEDFSSSTCDAMTVITTPDQGIDPARLSTAGESISWNGCELQSEVGSVAAPDCAIAVPTHPNPAFSAFGGYVTLTPGEYVAKVTFVSSSVGPLGVVEVTVKDVDGELEIAAETVLPGDGSGNEIELELPFEIARSANRPIVETRIRSEGSYAYEIASISIRRAG